MGERAPETLVVTRANAEAAELLRHWRRWPGGAMALTGPRGAGKTHLGGAWAAETAARSIPADADPRVVEAAFDAAGGCLFIDDAGETANDPGLTHALDLARYRGGAVLMTGLRPPGLWPAVTADLATRWKALPTARLEEPDDALLEVVLRRLCRERYIELTDAAARYLAARMERTFAAAAALADVLDAQIVRGAKPVSVVLARRALMQMRSLSDMEGLGLEPEPGAP